MRSLIILSLLSACASTDAPSHVPNPLAFPFLAIGNGLSNASYNARRQKVSRFVNAHFLAIKLELGTPTTPRLTQAMNLAEIPAQSRPGILGEITQHPEIYQRADPEPLIVALMVHGR